MAFKQSVAEINKNSKDKEENDAAHGDSGRHPYKRIKINACCLFGSKAKKIEREDAGKAKKGINQKNRPKGNVDRKGVESGFSYGADEKLKNESENKIKKNKSKMRPKVSFRKISSLRQ